MKKIISIVGTTFLLSSVYMFYATAQSEEGVDVQATKHVKTQAEESIYSQAHSPHEGETLEQKKARMEFDKVWPSEQPEHAYIGAKKCSLCHKKEKHGMQYGIWQDSAHAKAYETLGTPEAKALAKKFGIDDPQQSGKCMRCHSTAYAFGEEKVTDAIPVEEAISCETCHGPGKEYMKMKIMKDREAAVSKGLRIPNEQTCLKCHNNTAPNVAPFNFEEAFELIKHPIPKNK